MKAGSTTSYDLETKRQRSLWKHGGSPDHRSPERANPPTNFGWSFFFGSTGFPLDRQGILCWDYKGVQEEIPSEEANILQIGSVAFPPGQYTSPQRHPLSQTIWPRWASRQFLTVLIVQTLLPVTFGYSLSSEAVLMRPLRRWKRLWRRPLTWLYKRTSIGSSRSLERYKCIAAGGDYFEGV